MSTACFFYRLVEEFVDEKKGGGAVWMVGLLVLSRMDRDPGCVGLWLWGLEAWRLF